MVKFNEIPQFTRRPCYQVNVFLRQLQGMVKDQIEDSGLQLCPDFQRGHVWTTEQQTAYVEYILRGGTSGREFYFNHPNWHIGSKGEYVCVDGLQRLTALLKFLDNELKVFGHLRNEFEDKLPLNANIVWHVNDLQTKKEVLTWYLEMNEGGTPHSKEELERVRKMIEGE